MKIFADTTEKELTSSQRRAIESVDRWMAVIAGAGSGKTTVLINRCLHLLKGESANLENLLAITFTERAAAQLKARLRHVLPPSSHHLLATAWVGTFHALCARILRNNAPLIGLDPSFGILDENAFHLLAGETIRESFIKLLEKRNPHALLLTDELDFNHAVSLLEELIDFRWHAKKILSQRQDADEREKAIHRALANCEAEIEKALLRAMERIGCIDFQELEVKTFELLTKVPSVREAYQKKFEHILVDEFQDTSDIQSELVFLLANPKYNKLAIVGDPRQSIYRFRGANVHCFEDAIKNIEKTNGEIVSLNENFRSEPAIISFVNQTFENLWTQIGSHAPSPMIAAREDVHKGPAVLAVQIDAPEKFTKAAELRRLEAQVIASHIKSMANSGKCRFCDITFLFQAMTNISEYEAAFKRHHIPYRFYGGRGLLERQEICDLIHALRYAKDPNDDVAFLGLLRSPLIGLSDEECARMAGSDGKKLRSALKGDARLSLLGFLEASAAHLTPSEILKTTIDRTGYEYVCASLDPSGGMQANIDRLIALAQSLEHEEPSPLHAFISFLSRLRERSARLGDPPAAGFGGDAVSCMTIHMAKGLEFPVVVLPDLLRVPPKAQGPWRFLRKEGVGFKLKNLERPFGDRIETERFQNLVRIDDLEGEEETKRLLYVAMTRARDLLILPVQRIDKSAGKWHEWLLPVLERSNSGVIKINVSNSMMPLKKSEDYETREPVTFVISPLGESNETGSKIFTVSELESYERCPREYYLKYVLNLPASNILADQGAHIPPHVRGSIVHGIIEKYKSSQKKTLKELISLACFNAGVFPDAQTMRAIEKALQNFINSDLAKDIDSGRREVRFDWRFGNAVITGSIDWLRQTKNGFEIIDFKTDSIDASEVKERAAEYDLQLVTYAMAANAALGAPISSTALYFLEPDIIFSESMNERRAKEGQSRIKRIIEHIINDEFNVGSIKPPCYKCPYKRNGMCATSQQGGQLKQSEKGL